MKIKPLHNYVIQFNYIEEYNEFISILSEADFRWSGRNSSLYVKTEPHTWLPHQFYYVRDCLTYNTETSIIARDDLTILSLDEFKYQQQLYKCNICRDTGKIMTTESYGNVTRAIQIKCPDCSSEFGISNTNIYIPQNKIETKGKTKMCNHIEKHTVDQKVIAICAPGISKEDVQVRADEENNKLIVVAESSMKFPKIIKDDMELDITHSFDVEPNFSAASSEVTVSNGMIIIVMATAEHIKSLEVK